MNNLKLDNISYQYANSKSFSLKSVNISVNSGEIVLIIGNSGSGKTTLLKQLKPSLLPESGRTGRVLIDGEENTESLERLCGYVFQSPDDQIVCEDVSHEIAFTLESVGMPNEEIKRKISETAEYFSITQLLSRRTSELSGGEKQLVALASVIAADPEILLLDEPISMLDGKESDRFIELVKKLNREEGKTVIISAHNIEKILPICTKVIALNCGKLVLESSAEALLELCRKTSVERPQKERLQNIPETALEIESLSFGFDSIYVLKDINLSVFSGEIFSIIGDNGAGKSTLLDCICGIKREASCGKLQLNGRVFYLPQDVRYLFTRESVFEEISSISRGNEEEVLSAFDLFSLQNRNPYDLSGGEQQRLALAMAYAANTDIFLLDEPTKGMDGIGKRKLISLLKELQAQGKTFVIVTHDMSFSSIVSDRCGRLENGRLTDICDTEDYFNKCEINDKICVSYELLREIIPQNDAENDKNESTKRHFHHKKTKRISPVSLILFALAIISIPLCRVLIKDRWAFCAFISATLFFAASAIYEFEKNRVSAGSVTILAVLCALAVAGRAAFFAVPNFKPTLAIIIITGASMGCNAGFIAGNIAMLVSNFLFGQGTWTVFQMFAAGIVGFLAGFISDKTEKRGYKLLISAFGIISAIVVYGGIVNPSYIITYQQEITFPMLIATYATGLPMDVTHGIGTGLFLWFGAVPMLKTLRRVKNKYGDI